MSNQSSSLVLILVLVEHTLGERNSKEVDFHLCVS